MVTSANTYNTMMLHCYESS